MSEYEICMDDLPESVRVLAELIGLDALKALTRYAGGTTMYIPKIDSLQREARNRRIKDEFTGSNHKQLAIRYNLSESQIREILAERFELPEQARFF